MEIPIYAKNTTKKTRTNKKQLPNNRSKSSNNRSNAFKSQLQFVREMAEEEDIADFLVDNDDTVSVDDQSMRSMLVHSDHKQQRKTPNKQFDCNMPSVMPFLSSVFDMDQVVTNQIMAARVAE